MGKPSPSPNAPKPEPKQKQNVWDKKKAVREKNKPSIPSSKQLKNKEPIKQNKKFKPSKSVIPNNNNSNIQKPATSSLRRSGGYKPKRVAMSYDSNAVDMTRKEMPRRQMQSTQEPSEAFPSLSSSTTKTHKSSSLTSKQLNNNKEPIKQNKKFKPS